ncbi:MAG: type II toxin-antitoxin system PemK/MazF family toxin [Actinomycetota bacterium]|nr:type II toxin-antitoxin system PemK/MazF family toxin [Actinomycetota bacterium]MDQ3680117.1 type II toxin-antitoxin system PemK/MazF family toxin [Actinomycetota bacterium]
MWWYEAPEVGRRPYLVLSRDEAIPVLNRVLAVPATRTIRDIPTEVELDTADGMPAHCALTLDNMAAIRPSLCTERITRLGADRMQQVCDALRHATAC